MTSGIYKIISPSGKFYIGSSKNIERRIKEHWYDCRKQQHKNQALQRAFNKYGPLPFVILLECEESELLYYEQKFIDDLKPAYNRSKVAGKVEFTDAVRAKMSASSQRRWSDPEERKRLAEKSLGRRHKPETIAKLSAKSKAFVNSEKGRQHIANLAKVLRGRVVPDETRKKLSESAKGRVVSEEARKKMSEAKKGKSLTEEHKLKISLGLRKRKGKVKC